MSRTTALACPRMSLRPFSRNFPKHQQRPTYNTEVSNFCWQVAPPIFLIVAGSGLGLYISKRLTELLDGKIHAISAPGKGAILKFYILGTQVEDRSLQSPRLQNGHLDPLRPGVAIATHSRCLRSATLAHSKMKRKTLLIVEDNLVNQRLMVKMLSGAYEIHTANNGLECLQIMQSDTGRSIDLVLCDIEMPVMNGYEAVQQVKEWQRSQGVRPIRFLAVSANARPEQVKKMLDAGMDQTIRKPFGRDDILKVVAQMLEHGQ